MFQRPDGTPRRDAPLRPALADKIVRFVGEQVAAVVAETPEIAKDAVEAIVVEYEELPVVTSLIKATSEGAPLVWPAATGNVAAQMKHGDAAACDAAFASAAPTSSRWVCRRLGVLVPIKMARPRAALATSDAESGRVTLRLSTQMPSAARDGITDALGIEHDTVRVIVGDVGGGFGMKGGFYPEDIVVVHAARSLNTASGVAPSRLDEFSPPPTAAIEFKAELALDADGKVLG